jgi:glycosyltransferase involved in cell wall biosynthesis
VSGRVLHVVKVAGISGAENHLLLLLPALRDRGWDVAAVMLHEGEPGAEDFAVRLEADGVPVERVRLSRAFDPRAFARILRRARRDRPDVVHTHLVHADFHGLPAGRLARVPALVSTKHGFNAFRDRKAFATADRAESEGFDAATFEVVHYGIEAGSEPPPLPGAPRLAIVGRLIPIKGHDVLLRAVARARERLPGLTLEIAGDGELEQELRATAIRLGLGDAVTFLGRVAPVDPVLERAEVVVVPSFGEGFGMVALEAMERGRPVIASAVGGLPEIVDEGRTGLLVPPGDVEALVRAIAELADDPARAAGMGQAGRARALDGFSQERCTERIAVLYETALAGGERRFRRRSSQARSSANAASNASTKSHGAR